jgi:hypothetical protein
MQSWFTLFVAIVGILVACPNARGHARNESYVWLNVRSTGLDGRFEIRLDDLRNDLGVQVARDIETARQQLAESAAPIQDYLLERFTVGANGADLPIEFVGVDVVDAGRQLGSFARFEFRIDVTDIPDELLITNTVLFDVDPSERSLLCMQTNEKTGEEFGEEFTALVFGPSNPQQVLVLTDIQGLPPARDFVWKGARAVLGHAGHLGFILVLLLATVVVRRDGGWAPAPDLKTAGRRLIVMFAAFSLAHGLTLGLAGLGVMRAPAAVVGPAVGLSVLLLALNNMFVLFGGALSLVVFFLGLFHGLELNDQLSGLPFRMIDMKRVLLGYTIGVEFGQAAAVLLLWPWIYALRRFKFFLPGVLVSGSLMIALATTGTLLWWVLER